MMLLAVIVLGAPVLLIAGALVSVACTRRALASTPGVFPCKIGRTRSVVESCDVRWPTRTSYGMWVHDSLVVIGGLLRITMTVLDVSTTRGIAHGTRRHTVSGLGRSPVVLHLELRDRRT